MITDIYGDVKSFYLPDIDAPEEIKNRFRTGGMQSFTEQEIEDYFLDVMQYDALISGSTIKTDFYTKGFAEKYKSAAARNAARSDLFYSVLTDVGGMRAYKTGEGF